jgi:hypothetical protein
VLRHDDDPHSEVGDFPTLGGAAVIDSEDEDDFEYLQRGDGKILFMGQYEPQDMADADNYALPRQLVEAQIVSDAGPDAPAFFHPERHDIVQVLPGLGVSIVYEVVQVLSVHPAVHPESAG